MDAETTLAQLRAILNRGRPVGEEIPDEGLAEEMEDWIALALILQRTTNATVPK